MARRKSSSSEPAAEITAGAHAAVLDIDVPAAPDDEGEPQARDGAAALDGEGDRFQARDGAAATSAETAADQADAAASAETEVPSAGVDGDEDEVPLGGDSLSDARLLSITESLLFATDRPLTIADLKRLVGVRDGKRVEDAVQALTDRALDTGVQVVSAAGGFRMRTNPANGEWVGRLLAGKPVRLSRAMLETLAIVAYRQPITRPEIDDIRGVDCGPVLKTLLDRNLVRIIGKKEEVGRPLLYASTPEFLRVFNLKDLTELPTLREFHELNADSQAKLAAKHGSAETDAAPLAPPVPTGPIAPHAGIAGRDPDEDETLLEELDEATQAAARAVEVREPEAPADPPPDAPSS